MKKSYHSMVVPTTVTATTHPFEVGFAAVVVDAFS